MNKLFPRVKNILTLTFLTAAALFSALDGGDRVSANNSQRRTEMFKGREVAAGQALVKFRDSTTPRNVKRAKASADVEMDKQVGGRGARLLQSRSKDAETLVRELSAREDVLYAEPNYIIHTTAAPDDPKFSEQWALQNTGYTNSVGTGTPGADIGAVSAWEVSKGSRDAVVAVVDTGIDYNHPDLAANVWSAPAAFTVTVGGATVTCAAGTHGFNALANSCDPLDDSNHGTHVAGIAGAVGGNGAGVTGVSQTASLMGLKFTDAAGNGTLEGAINAIEFAIQAKRTFGPAANVRVLSNSWGWNGNASQALLDEIGAADANGMLFVAGAGNSGADNDLAPFYPASYDARNVLSVAATDNNDALASVSNWSSNFGKTSVDLGAPGKLILSTVIGGSYDWFSGTSMATPQVSGAAALVLSKCSLDTLNLKNTLLDNVDPVASLSGVTSTGGRLNVNKAIRDCSDPLKQANSLPAVELTNVHEGDSFAVPAVIVVGANAADGDGSVGRVDFYSGAQLIGTDSTSPYMIDWYVPVVGTYSLTAVAVDNTGATTTSRSVNVVVNETIIPDPTPTPTPTPTPSPTPKPTPTPSPTPTPAPPPAFPAAPAGLVVSRVRSGEMLLRWSDNSTNEQGFEIERSTSASKGFAVLAMTGANVTNYTDRAAQMKLVYYYRVRSTNGNAKSAYSNTASVRAK